jgi:hypothetical protein
LLASLQSPFFLLVSYSCSHEAVLSYRTEASEQAQLTNTLQQLTASIAAMQTKMASMESKMST